MQIPHRTPLLLGLVCIIMIALPFFLSRTWLSIMIYLLVTIYLCSAWNISALPGLFSLMHAVFFSCGAYVSSILWIYLNISPWFGMIAGAFVAFLLALGIGWCCFRVALPILSFAIFTLIVSTIILFALHSFPIGDSTEGLLLVYRGTHPFYFQFQSKITFYFIILGMVVGILFLAKHIITTKIGIYSFAIHDNERVAAACGVDVIRYKLITFSISAVLTSFAGTFWAQYYRFVSPEYVEPFEAIIVILLTVVGGIGTLWGPVIGPVILIPFGEILRIHLAGLPGLHLIIYGIVLVIILLGLRQGLVPWFNEWRRRQRSVHMSSAPDLSRE